jgi:hypothetical protein
MLTQHNRGLARSATVRSAESQFLKAAEPRSAPGTSEDLFVVEVSVW